MIPRRLVRALAVLLLLADLGCGDRSAQGWKKYPIPVMSAAGDVWISPAGDVWVRVMPGLVYRIVGDELRQDPEIAAMWGKSSAMAKLGGTAADDLWFGDFAHFDGQHWKQVRDIPAADYSGAESTLDIWGAGPDLYVLLTQDARLKQYNGRVWSGARDILRPEQGRNALALHGTSGSDIHLVGARGLFVHFNGREWRTLPWEQPPDGTEGFSDVWAISAVEAYAVGGYSPPVGPRELDGRRGVLARWDGSRWAKLPSPTREVLVKVAGCEGRLFVASRHTLFERTTQGSWEVRLTARDNAEFKDVFCAAGLLAVHEAPAMYEEGVPPCPTLWVY